ncbi:adenine phosphoribosyltransferase [Catenaria anguillulae PL171]|uniref:adenine phosphoribosyltransferase n=1 Tax=Catenaria anguillulae PL171 TaxID=765915 RepID=A0A1Y2HKZ3_9FUNG|nr:adenine phosphoribosyltransferase [Catenaria anguillulae PL171]
MSNQATKPTTDGLDRVRTAITAIPDFPLPGILFRDLFPVFRDPLALEALVSHLVTHLLSLPTKPDLIVGIDARGFLLGPILALRIGAGFAPVRKRGKLPGEVVSTTYEKEYGPDVVEFQKDAVKKGMNVVVVDDLIATGGSAKAAGDLVGQLGGKVLEYLFVIELEFLQGRKVLDAPVYSAIKY